MNSQEAFLQYSASPEFAQRIARLYGTGDAVKMEQTKRYGNLVKRHAARFGEAKETIRFFSAPGRTEIGGNHTDHNAGRVLAAAVTLDTVAAVTPSSDNVIVVDSEGYAPITVDLSDLKVHPEQYGTTLSLIRGTAARMKELGYMIGGFKA